MKNIIIRTVDSDILIKALGMSELITPKHDNKNVCVGFKKGEAYVVYDINESFIYPSTRLKTVTFLSYLHRS